ncbi:transmembrane protein 9B-like isoform X1 [Pieris brassicae]|uniref:Transmembrane protein 9 n=1 Tax=Pieris brassicae TaxID=7116 RepID=A0A9P0TUE1_PIEBR|nr:transmembrane protein 9B-like isoform X1 [Pieris brassicae]CAH4038613.1 unnamed protein product [Pieris brassicae]
MFTKLVVLICFGFSPSILAQFYEDQRCRCVCPSQSAFLNKTVKGSDRKLYIAFVPPNKCTCDAVILPLVSDEIRQNAQIFCPRCDCTYESRNTTIIMVVVIMVLCVLMLLSAYFIFLSILGPLAVDRKLYVHVINDEAQRPLMHDDSD